MPGLNPHGQLHFVTLTGPGSVKGSESDSRLSLRSLVMQSYIRQRNDPKWQFSPASISTDMRTHVSKFKAAKKSRPPHHAKLRRKAASTREHVDKLRKIASATPAPSAHDLDMLDPFQTLSINLSESETLDLLQYYHVSFSANSHACNPEGRWLATAIMDAAMLHATLSLVAIHRRDKFSSNLSKLYFEHRGEAMKIIGHRLTEADQAISDATIGAVALLSSSDNHFDWSSEVQSQHSIALARLIAMRGGIKSLRTNRHIQRVVGWADLLHSAMHNTKPRLNLPFSSALNMQHVDEPMKITDQGTSLRFGYSNVVQLQYTPFPVAKIIQGLRDLMEAKNSLLKNRNEAVCRSFSDLLWRLEYSILAPEDVSKSGAKTAQVADLFSSASIIHSIGTAALILSYSSLRELVAPVLFDKLGNRLRAQLSHHSLLEDLGGAEEKRSSTTAISDFLNEDQLSILLWILYLGWKCSTDSTENRAWFLSHLAQVSWQHNISSDVVLLAKLQRVIPQQELLGLKDLWSAMNQDVRSEISTI